MEFMTGVNKKETLEIGDLLTGSYEGKSVKVNGAVHTISIPLLQCNISTLLHVHP